MENMSLRFPNARLLVQYLVANKRLPVDEAIKAAASQLRLINEAADLNNTPLVHAGICKCRAATKEVLEKYVARRAATRGLPISASRIWDALNRDLQAYELAHKRPTTKDKGRDNGNGHDNHKQHDSGKQHDSEKEYDSHDCASFAPVMLDLLLQQVRRYD